MGRVRPVLVTLLPALLVAAPADAATYCVSDPACPADGVAQPTVQAATAAAAARAGADLVRVGPGRFTAPGGVAVAAGDTLAGTGQTTIAGPVELEAARAVLRDVTVQLAAGQPTGVSASGGAAVRVTIDGAAAGAGAVGFAGRSGASFEDGTIRMAAGAGAAGDGPGAPRIVGSTVDAPVGVTASDGIDVARTRIVASVAGVRAPDGGVELDAVLIGLRGEDATGVAAGPAVGAPAPAAIRHVTVRGSGAARQTGVSVRQGCEAGDVELRADAIVLAAVDTALERVTACSASGPPAGRTTLAVTRSAFDPGRVRSSGPGAALVESPVTPAPALDADGVPPAGSALIDAGDPATTGTDLRGLPRPVDGDGDGVAIADVGALERQPATPPAVPVADPPPAGGGVLGTLGARVAPGPLRVRVVPYRAARPGRYEVRARLAFPAGTSPSGAVTTLRVRVAGRSVARVRTRMDRRGRAAFKLRIRPRDRRRTRLQVGFAGTESLTGRSSARVRMPAR